MEITTELNQQLAAGTDPAAIAAQPGHVPAAGGETVLARNTELFKQGGVLLQTNKSRAAKAVQLGENLEALITLNGGKLDPELEQKAADFITACTTAKSQMETQRKPITQMMDLAKAEFTAAERELDHKAPGTIANRIQAHRNAYAKEIHEAELQRQADAQREKDKGQEAAKLRGQADTQLVEYVLGYLLEKKQELNGIFGRLALDSQEEVLKQLQDFPALYPYDHFNAWRHNLVASLHTAEELDLLAHNVWIGRFSAFSTQGTAELSELKEQLVAMVPSRLVELQQIADAEPDLQATMLAELQERQAADDQRLQEEHQAGVKEQLDHVGQQVVQEQTQALFTQVHASQPAMGGPKRKVTYAVRVLHPAGWPLIFQFWYQIEGKDMDVEKAGKKSLEAMRKFAGDAATKGGARIVDTPHLEYYEDVTATNARSTSKKTAD